ncbi:MAG: serine/threonine protein kinase [Planctomycetes bacterium]|nr:serine/threonine protein kinase [Planctomycetota bacterium]
MGVVYQARRKGRPVALKILAPGLQGDSRSVHRFLREGAAASAIDHPNVVRLLDSGEEGGTLYLVLELVGGESLARELATGRFFGFQEIVDLGRQAAAGLAAIHDVGIVHRDVKPANLLVTAEGVLKVADFGLVRSEHFATLSSTGQMMGTPAYMSPEQAEGRRDLDRRSDVYSLGATLFHLTAGVPPFRGESPIAVLRAHCEQPVPSLEPFRPDVPAGLAGTIETMLAKRRDERFADMREVSSALERSLAGPRGARRAALRKSSSRRRRRTPTSTALWAGLALGVAGAVALAYSLLVAADARWEPAGEEGRTAPSPAAQPAPPGGESPATEEPRTHDPDDSGAPERGADELVKDVGKALREDRTADARRDIEEFVRRFPEDPRAVLLGRSLPLLDDPEFRKSLAHGTELLHADPAAYRRLVLSEAGKLEARGEIEAARAMYEQVAQSAAGTPEGDEAIRRLVALGGR